MKKSCVYCGAMLGENIKICSNCGKVLPSATGGRVTKKPVQQANHNRNQFDGEEKNFVPERTRSETRTVHKSYTQYKKTSLKDLDDDGTKQRRSARVYYDNVVPNMSIYKGNFEETMSSGKENASHIKPIIGVFAKILVILVIIYFAFAAIRILTTSHGSCNFETEMTLRASNYSQAFDNYFATGKWRYNLKDNQVTYEGTDYDGDKYKMTFKHDGEYVIVDTMIKNSVSVTDEKVRTTELLGMFMAQGSV